MNPIIASIVAIIAAYIIGSFPSAYIIGKLRKGVDIRKIGSRNMGAMNTFYNVGFWYGISVLALDIGKGALAVAVAYWLGTHLYVQFAAGIAAVIGHNLPVFLKFKGGKGGATCIGVLWFFIPWGVPIGLAIFGVMMLITKYPTLSYSVGFLGFIGAGWFIYHSLPLVIYSIVLLLIPLLRYVPRIFEMRSKGGSWKHVAMRRNLKDRL
jgi:glycerol-3-phosphate acyltransferase PlsY